VFIPTGYAQINLMWTWTASSQTAECEFGVNLDGYPGGVSEAASDVLTAYGDANMKVLQTNHITLTNVHCKFGPNDTGAAGDAPAGIAGDLSTQGLTPNTCVLITKVTELGGRHGRGRMYWPGWEEGTVDSYGILDDDAFGAFVTHMTEFHDALDSAGLPMELLHTADTPDPSPIVALTPQRKVATQRRRLGR
jgi:hypothetical protein